MKDQIDLWAVRHPEWHVERSCERSLPEIRRLLRSADAAMVDATQDSSQAVDAFLQAVARLGAGAVALYTETTHHGLEVFARLRGSLFLLGPLFDDQWEDVFQRLLCMQRALPAWRNPAMADALAFARRQGRTPGVGRPSLAAQIRPNRLRYRLTTIPGEQEHPGGKP